MRFNRAAVFVLFVLTSVSSLAADAPPPVPREFRGVWVATVDNIDWPSKPGLPVEKQKEEMLRILDRSRELNLNAIVFQVRPAGDALYASELEPWSAYLTGEQGKAPEPFYDPLAFAVEEAHARGLELHVWFNPYRARHPSEKGPFGKTHLSQTHPDLVKKYGKYLWMDPGEKAVQDHSLAVVADVVKRYDVDGIHLDDYFYPYKEKDEAGNILDFPDEPSYARYREAGGTLAKDDWRRENVDTFIRRMYEETKAAKPWVKVGIAPFGIWRPGNPPQIQGFDPYAELYADSRKWLQEGWCDYFTPQLYWPVGQTAQDYPTLQKWWIEQNTVGRHIWPGLFTSRVGDSSRNWEASVIAKQIEASRAQPGATGNIHFSMKAILQERPGLVETLKTLYAEPALVPASPWIDDMPPAKPVATAKGGRASWQRQGGEPPFVWVVRTRSGDKWATRIVAGGEDGVEVAGAAAVAVSAVDRAGNESEAAVVEFGGE
jgi:uncharacterized lipoprotein YddW (UPF0748 family)